MSSKFIALFKSLGPFPITFRFRPTVSINFVSALHLTINAPSEISCISFDYRLYMSHAVHNLAISPIETPALATSCVASLRLRKSHAIHSIPSHPLRVRTNLRGSAMIVAVTRTREAFFCDITLCGHSLSLPVHGIHLSSSLFFSFSMLHVLFQEPTYSSLLCFSTLPPKLHLNSFINLIHNLILRASHSLCLFFCFYGTTSTFAEFLIFLQLIVSHIACA